MNIESQELFDSLVEKDPLDLSKAEIAFLRARRSYLSPVQREIYGEVLGLTEDEMTLSASQKRRLDALNKAENKAKSKAEDKKEVKGTTDPTGDVEVLTADEDGKLVPLSRDTKPNKK